MNEHEFYRHLLGFGLDNQDGHKRITKGPGFHLIGGSHETHEIMVERTVKLSEKLKKKGQIIQTASPGLFYEAALDVGFKFPDYKIPPDPFSGR